MNMHPLNKLWPAAFVAFGLGVGALSHAQGQEADQAPPTAETLEAILEVGKAKTVAAVASQARIDRLAEETRTLLADYRKVLKQVDDMKVHNARLRKRIQNQLRRIKFIEESIIQVTVTHRRMMPLVIRMIDGLEQFVDLDVPFHINERRQRIKFLRSNLDRTDVEVSEKFRQVLEAYKIENEYGRKIDAYKGSVEIDGVERDVNFLRVGRVALLYQTTDTELSGAWDQSTRSWVELGGGYRNAILKGLRIARNEASIDLLNLPIPAPEAIQ